MVELIYSLFISAHQRLSPPEMDISEQRLTTLTNVSELQAPVTSHQDNVNMDRQLPLLPEPHRLEFSSIEPRYTERPGLPLMLPRFQSNEDIRLSERMEPRFGEPRSSMNSSSLSAPFASTSSNLAILEESRAISTLSNPTNVGTSTYQMLSSDIFNPMNAQPSIASPFSIPGSPQLPSSLIYPHLHTSTPQNLQNSIYVPTGEVRTYEILGSRPTGEILSQRQSEMMVPASMDISMRIDRPLLSPTQRLALESSPMTSRHDDRSQQTEMQTNQSPLHDGTGLSPPRVRANGDNDSYWRPYLKK